MNSEYDNFDRLRRLLALKRHEQPPPGYFNGFSRQVIARIKAGEQGGREFAEGSWFQRLWVILEAKPIFAGAFGAAVCVLLLSGIMNSGEAGMSPMLINPVAAEAPPAFAEQVNPGVDGTYPVHFVSGSNSISGLFRQFQLQTQPQLQAQPATLIFAAPGGN